VPQGAAFNQGNHMHFQPTPSVEAGKVYRLVITAVNPRGEGIAHNENFAVFVKGGVAGKAANVRIVEVKRTYAIGIRE